MRVLQIHNSYKIPGGEDAVVRNEFELLTNHGISVEQWQVSNHSINTPLSTIQTALSTSYSRRSRNDLQMYLKDKRFDVAHIHNFFPILTTSIYDTLRANGIPVVQTLHNFRSLCAGGLFLRNGKICENCLEGSPYKSVLHKCYRDSHLGTLAVAHAIEKQKTRQVWKNMVDRFIVLTDFARKKFIQGGFPAHKLRVKPNFVTTSLPKGPPPPRQGALFVGRLSHEKGIEHLLAVWEKLEAPLTIAGSGPLEGKIKSLAPKNVKLVGHLSPAKVQSLMTRAQFLVLPSRCYEGFPLVIAEAFANGLPIIASRLGAMEELIDDHYTGLHFTPDDPADLRRKVLFALENPAHLASWGKNSRTVFKQRYSPASNFELLMNIYGEAITASTPLPPSVITSSASL